MDRLSITRVTYGEEYLMIYREYYNSEGERVVEHEKRKRMDAGNESGVDGEECMVEPGDVQGKRRRTVQEEENSSDNEEFGDEDVLEVENGEVERTVKEKETSSSSEEEFVSADEAGDEEDSDGYITVDEADISADVLLEFQGSDVDGDEPDAECDQPDMGSATHKKGKYCPICKTIITQRLRRHAEEQHVPWFLSPNRACWTCKGTAQSATFAQYSHHLCERVSMGDEDIPTFVQLANGVLELIREDLECSSWEDLLQMVITKGWHPRANLPTELSLQQKITLWLWEKENRRTITPVNELTIAPPGSVACLLHYKVLLHILPNVTTQTKQMIQQGEYLFKGNYRQFNRKVLRTIDAHCHLDLIESLGFYEGKRWDSPLVVTTLISNFVFPATWYKFDQWMSHEKVYGTVGLHPNICQATPKFAPEILERLNTMMQHPRCVALGEIGLDYLRGPTLSQRITQRDHLRALLELRPRGMPVILHCRSDPKDTEEPLQDALQILKTTVPRTTAIMLHCFMGSDEDRDLFLSNFPKTIFSISPKCLQLGMLGQTSLKSAIRGLQLDQVVLETDFPYLSKTPRQDLYYIAKWVGTIKGLCPTIVLEAARLNVERFFKLYI
jgi:TatD DNase family protein